MATELEKASANQQISFKETIKESLDYEQIINNSHDSIFVTDKYGNVLLANASTERLLGVKPDTLIGKNVRDLVKKGIYDSSPSLKAIETRSLVTMFLKTGHGLNLMDTSTPLLDENGEILMVITNARDKDLVDKYLEALEQKDQKLNGKVYP